jgi:fused signal recognition particle receptor
MTLFQRLKDGLAKTRAALNRSLDWLTGRTFDPTVQEELEAALLAADLGIRTVSKLMERCREQRVREARDLRAILRTGLVDILTVGAQAPLAECIQKGPKPFVVLVIGVNGVGKTTTIAKLAARLRQAGLVPLLVAADTFRAAAIEQLVHWGSRLGLDVIRHRQGADPSAVAYDGLSAAKARGADVVLIDTAGRLHTKANLMEELKKMKRVLARELPGAPHEVLLVLDGTVGQNALVQARQFHEAVGVTGLAVTKLDGTAKGGAVVAIVDELRLPVRLIGVGESVEDLQDFDARAFVDALVGDDH